MNKKISRFFPNQFFISYEELGCKGEVYLHVSSSIEEALKVANRLALSEEIKNTIIFQATCIGEPEDGNFKNRKDLFRITGVHSVIIEELN